MLMQSADGDLHVLPALPDVWPAGIVKGLRALGGFEIIDMEWKDAKLVRLIVKSSIGGNLRLRVPNAMKLNSIGLLAKAVGKNPNPFYQVEETPNPIVSAKANVNLSSSKTHFFMILRQRLAEHIRS
jgi:alpha-L-fucosidase 2